MYIKLPESIVLTAVEFYARPDDSYSRSSRPPGKFKLYGSKDGVSWDVWHDQANTRLQYTQYSARVEVQQADVKTAYSYIGVVVGSVGGLNEVDANSYILQIIEWKIFGRRCLQVQSCVQSVF